MKPPLIYLPTLASQESLIRGLTEQGILFHKLRGADRAWESWSGYSFTPWVSLEEREDDVDDDAPRWYIDGQPTDAYTRGLERMNSVSHFLAYAKRLQES